MTITVTNVRSQSSGPACVQQNLTLPLGNIICCLPGNFIWSFKICEESKKKKKGLLKIPELPNNSIGTKVKRFSKLSTSYHIISVLFDRS
jgi:hypothetical protein